MNGPAKAAWSFSLFLALGMTQADAKSAFCTEKVRDLRPNPAILGKGFHLNYMDESAAQITCLDCEGFRTVEVFLGVNDDKEQALRDGSLTADTLTKDCLDVVPNCSATTFVEGPSVGYSVETVHSGMAQRQYLLFNGGKVLTVRGTAVVADHARISADTEAVFRSVLPKLHCGQ